jgi:hypothetical protein
VTDEINGKCTATGDEFWDAMERKPDYSAFLGRFDGRKNYRRISPDIWARWDQANLKSQTEESFWAQMEREPDLQALIGRYGGYPLQETTTAICRSPVQHHRKLVGLL